MDNAEETRPAEKAEIIDSDLVRTLETAIEDGNREEVSNLTEDLRAPDLADLIEALPQEQRAPFILSLGSEIEFDAFSELDEAVRDPLLEELPNEYLAKAVVELESDDAAYVLDGLEEEDREDVLQQMPIADRTAFRRNLEYDEETAGRIMQADFVTVAPFWNVGQTIDHLREAKDLPDTFSEIYVVDPTYRVLGSVGLSKLVRTKRNVPIADIMSDDVEVVQATEDQEEVARQFNRYDLLAAPVVDDNERMVGVVTVDDMVEVIQDEADEDIKRLGGVGDESLLDNVIDATKSRFVWLLINLGTAILASLVIKQFDASIEQLVALAVLMPIVASMGGNAGTQTMTVAVVALGTKDLGPRNAVQVVMREAAIGLLNGLIFAIILAAITVVWFGSGPLGMVIAAAMIFNHFAAAVAGIAIPLALDKLGYDPAIASGVFLTTVTDVVGFFAFLGLATLFLL